MESSTILFSFSEEIDLYDRESLSDIVLITAI